MSEERPVRYAVLRAAPGVPVRWMPPGMEGLWLDLRDMPAPVPSAILHRSGTARAVDRYETREDGERAQVYEVRP